VAVRAHDVVLLEHRARREHHVRELRRVGQEGVDHDEEVDRSQRACDRARVGELAHGVAVVDDARADLGVGAEDLLAEQRLGERARPRVLRPLDPAGVEPAAALEVVRDPAAGHAQVARDGPERVEQPDGRRPVEPAPEAPADEERGGLRAAVQLRDLAGRRDGQVGPGAPLGDRAAPGERGEGVEAVGVGRRLRIDPPLVEEDARDGEREEAVAAGAHGVVPVAERERARAVDRIDLDHGHAAGARLLQVRDEVDAGLGHVLAPEDEGAAVLEVGEVVGVLVAHVGHLRGVAGARADVAPLVGDGAEELEEMAVQELDHAERSTARVMEDGRRAEPVPRLAELLGDEIERLVPAGRLERVRPADERLREAIGRVLAFEVVVGAVAEEAAGDRVRGVAAEARDLAVLDRREDLAGVRAVPGAGGADLFAHAPVLARSGGDPQGVGP
jgi:hypothetical protein